MKVWVVYAAAGEAASGNITRVSAQRRAHVAGPRHPPSSPLTCPPALMPILVTLTGHYPPPTLPADSQQTTIVTLSKFLPVIEHHGSWSLT